LDGNRKSKLGGTYLTGLCNPHHSAAVKQTFDTDSVMDLKTELPAIVIAPARPEISVVPPCVNCCASDVTFLTKRERQRTLVSGLYFLNIPKAHERYFEFVRTT
jgi:hypothetical protein